MTDIDRVIEEVKTAVLPYESWRRLTGESAAAYGAFCAFRDYGPERNIRKTVEETEKDETKWRKRYRVWRNWATLFRWRERAADYDLYLDRLRQAERRKTIEAQGEVYRAATGKMLQVVQKKLDTVELGDLTQGAVVEWLTTAISMEREIAGVASGVRDAAGAAKGGQPEIRFSPEFEGL
jgi:hypothetical protein